MASRRQHPAASAPPLGSARPQVGVEGVLEPHDRDDIRPALPAQQRRDSRVAQPRRRGDLPQRPALDRGGEAPGEHRDRRGLRARRHAVRPAVDVDARRAGEVAAPGHSRSLTEPPSPVDGGHSNCHTGKYEHTFGSRGWG